MNPFSRNPFRFTSIQNAGGVGAPLSRFPRDARSWVVTPLECALTQNDPASPLESALTENGGGVSAALDTHPTRRILDNRIGAQKHEHRETDIGDSAWPA